MNIQEIIKTIQEKAAATRETRVAQHGSVENAVKEEFKEKKLEQLEIKIAELQAKKEELINQ